MVKIVQDFATVVKYVIGVIRKAKVSVLKIGMGKNVTISK